MPNLKSSCKQLKKSKKRYNRNKAVRSELKTRIKKFKELVAENKTEEAKAYLKEIEKRLMQAAGKNIIHKNKTSRHVSRLMVLLNKTKSQ